MNVVSTFLVHDRRPEALVSMLALFYNSGDIGAVATSFATKLGNNTFKHLLYVHTDFHEQKPVQLSTVAPNSCTTARQSCGRAGTLFIRMDAIPCPMSVDEEDEFQKLLLKLPKRSVPSPPDYKLLLLLVDEYTRG